MSKCPNCQGWIARNRDGIHTCTCSPDWEEKMKAGVQRTGERIKELRAAIASGDDDAVARILANPYGEPGVCDA